MIFVPLPMHYFQIACLRWSTKHLCFLQATTAEGNFQQLAWGKLHVITLPIKIDADILVKTRLFVMVKAGQTGFWICWRHNLHPAGRNKQLLHVDT